MRDRLLGLWVVMALVLCISGAWAQSAPTMAAQNIAKLKKQAESGDAKAQYNLGSRYYNGQGVSQNYAEAAVWFRKAAQKSDAEAEFMLGWLCEYGPDPENYHEAVRWFSKAAEQGYAKAQFFLGADYNYGIGIQSDPAQAAIWYRKAAEQGFPQAQESLGWCYVEGRGVPQDYIEGYFWLDLSEAGELDTSRAAGVAKERDEAASHLTPADLSRVQERARKWFEDHPVKANPQ